jgi:hypothetical protein
MIFHVVFATLAQHVAGKECSAEFGGVCLLQLRNGENRPGEVEPVQHSKADQRVDDEVGLPDLDPLFTATDNLAVLGEVESEQQVSRGKDEMVVPPVAPTWEKYPSALVDILDKMVVTRWNGDRKPAQSKGLSSPVPGLYKKFDCVRHGMFKKTSQTCRTLLVENTRLIIAKCLREIEIGTLNVTSGVFVAFMGTDHFLSDPGYLALVKKIGKNFQKTYYESYDVMDDDVDVLPIGLSEYYLRFQDWNVLSNLAQNLSPQESRGVFLKKEGMVLGAFGAFFSVQNPSRKSAQELCESHGQETWLTCEQVSKDEWWSTLRSFRFLLNPAGGGLQSTKFYEALLARTVPICTKAPAFEKLHEKGWPMVLVDDYSEVEHLNLSEIYEELKPRLESIQQHLHLDAYWNYLETGHL